ncbi:MAG: hypothetical protein IPO78_10835 [Saprospiraceae bacterium]|nr:hypothetical protein [Saprospiraceae bacterium]MBK8451578.1 hypothetical protein [Saprospiraceae bacterium]MBK8486012.1 hypothetical protein [Saprospiraceae bacterium]MBK9221055.1 hypothetical protein [Saprospiraceae bacterium]MBK9722093.1 hypothetical protein [Saprospiraceae bacterium]
MKNIFIFLSFLLIFSWACSDHDDDNLVYDYHAHIEAPDNAAKFLGDSMEIHINFESHKGETVHHINVRIFNKATNAEIYNKPSSAHVDDPSGEYQFKDAILLSGNSGFVANTSYVLEAKVWGHEDFVELQSSKVEFLVK